MSLVYFSRHLADDCRARSGLCGPSKGDLQGFRKGIDKGAIRISTDRYGIYQGSGLRAGEFRLP